MQAPVSAEQFHKKFPFIHIKEFETVLVLIKGRHIYTFQNEHLSAKLEKLRNI